MIVRAVLYLLFFALLISLALLGLVHFVSDIEDVAPDALHFVGFLALVPMISSVGGRLAARKIAYIKNRISFKPAVIAAFLASYLSLIPWVLSFFITNNSFLVYIDWAIVLSSILLSFIGFSFSLLIFLTE